MEDIFSQKIRASLIGQAPVTHRLEANEAEREKLGPRLGLPAIAALSGVFVLHHEKNGVIAGTLEMRAEVTQICVVTLEPFPARVAERTALRFVPAGELAGEDGLVLDPETLEGPDEIPYDGEGIDLGAALAEQLALALDPYPRKPGAQLPAEAGEAQKNPFAALRDFPIMKKND